jgi:hypothetical protein
LPLYLNAWARLLRVRLMLWLLPFARLRPGLAAMMQPPRGAADEAPIRDVIAAVRRTRHFVPRASCLVQAMAAYQLLARRGSTPQLVIGVAAQRQPNGKPGLEAHAWLELGDHVVLGDHVNLDRFARLPQFPKMGGKNLYFE